MKLGEILVKHGMITPEILASALSAQQAHGERLGTHLVENGVLTSDQVTLALAKQLNVPPALDADFARSEINLRRRLGAHQATKLQAIPLWVTGSRRVAVAMVNPTDPSVLEELSFILGAAVEPMVAAEHVIAYQLEQFYSMPRRRRTTGFNLPATFANHDYNRTSRAPSPAPSSRMDIVSLATDMESWSKEFSRPVDLEIDQQTYEQACKGPPPIRLAPLQFGPPQPGAPVAFLDDSACFTPSPVKTSPPTRTPVPPTQVPPRRNTLAVPVSAPGRDLAVEMILQSPDRQAASDNLFAFLRANFEVGAMFAASGHFAEGRFGYYRDAMCKGVEGVVFSLSLPSCFRIARSRHAAWKGVPPPDGLVVHRLVWNALGVAPPKEVMVCPVIVDRQISVLLYVQGKNGGMIEKVAADRLERVCEALGDSLLRLAG